MLRFLTAEFLRYLQVSERFPDEAPNFTEIVDSANYLADLYNSACVAAERAKAAPEQLQLEDGSWPSTECVDCGIDIEPGRLALGRVRCIVCQTNKEIKERQYYGRR